MTKRFSSLLFLFIALVAGAQINTDQVIRIGQNALYFDDYMLSIQYFNQAIHAKPYLAQPYLYRAIAKLNLEDFLGAEEDADKAIELNPFLTDAWEVRGVARQNLANHAGAIADYAEALKLLPRNRQLLFNTALAYNDLKQYDKARETFNQVLRYYPNFENAYLGRARASLATKDTVAAREDIDKALSLNANALSAYIMRADIAINSGGDLKAALADIDQAIKLEPRAAGLYINRAFLRYRLDSYSGAMSDYDYALTLEPYNMAALFNRGLLLLEVNANDLALDDFNRVLEIEPDDVRALYNRAIVLSNKGKYREAIADISKVAKEVPELPGSFYFRGDLHRRLGELAKAEADYKKAKALAKALPTAAQAEAKFGSISPDVPSEEESRKNQDEATRRRFASLLTVENNSDLREEYNNTAIRGRVQDKNLNIEIEPLLMLSFYTSPTELKRNSYYMREIDDLNATRALRFALAVTSRPPTIDEETAARHFQSIDYYNSYLSTHTPRPVDYIGRALDLLTVRDYRNAEKDADRAIALAPNLPLAYLIRAQARYGTYQLAAEVEQNKAARVALERKLLADIDADFAKGAELSPLSPVTYFNRGNILFEMGDFQAAIDQYSRAIALKADFGEAYYNRGYLQLKAGNREKGIADLSKAGELGVVPAYNLIKRISQ